MMSTIRADNVADRLGGGSIPMNTVSQGTAKAWFNLNGTGTIAARDSFNIASFTDFGTGNYGATFSTAMTSANYSHSSNADNNAVIGLGSTATSPFFATVNSAGALIDSAIICDMIFGDPS